MANKKTNFSKFLFWLWMGSFIPVVLTNAWLFRNMGALFPNGRPTDFSIEDYRMYMLEKGGDPAISSVYFCETVAFLLFVSLIISVFYKKLVK